MTPTDAQVEAAAKAMHEAHQLTRRLTTLGQCRALARIALGAAFQVASDEKLRADVAGARSAIGPVTPASEL